MNLSSKTTDFPVAYYRKILFLLDLLNYSGLNDPYFKRERKKNIVLIMNRYLCIHYLLYHLRKELYQENIS